ncbi:hypothetical protein EA473_06145 [Natrarchaeobius chitinivorans]|uniref:Uncharacterized protein n=1 Tax=Natrarchaeobius chitinivorans TaxID=1679083 RepID=A0A3N6LY84_NATCH|nr:hypothetical protein EA473_06145 [Natrarchaeobius chitinivorans]
MLVAGLTLISVLILLSNVLLTYINFKSSTFGDAATREQIMRDRYESMSAEKDLIPHREVIVSEPRVRDFGFKEWVKSLRPGGDYPGYTHFNVSIRHTNWPDDLIKLAQMEDKYRPTFHYPTADDLRENEKLQEMGVVQVETIREPQWEGNGKFIIVPIITHRVYIGSADPDDVEVVMENVRSVIREMEKDETLVEFNEPIKTRADLKTVQRSP